VAGILDIKAVERFLPAHLPLEKCSFPDADGNHHVRAVAVDERGVMEAAADRLRAKGRKPVLFIGNWYTVGITGKRTGST
jgi:DNA-binding LacI/PurR family transcriptional regulator